MNEQRKPNLVIRSTTIKAASCVVADWHRHHSPPTGALWAVSILETAGLEERICGVLIAGRPKARRTDNGRTIEVVRVATDGTFNACSMLYAAATRAARALGWQRIITFTLASESGASLRALAGLGWRCTGTTPGASWSVPSRPRTDQHPLGEKLRWECTL